MAKTTSEEIYFDESSGCLKITNKSIQILICTQSGGGKSIFLEGLAETYHKFNHSIVIFLNDPKNNFENAFLMFPATEKYHVEELRKQGRKPEGIPVRLWHPFTFDIPRHKLPQINFFTVPFSSIDRDLLNFLFETSGDTDEIKQILDSLRDLKSNEGFFEAIYRINQNLKDDEDRVGTKKIIKPKPPFYTTKIMSGTVANVADIQSTLKPLIVDYFIAPEQSPINLNVVKDIFNDQEHIHVLSCKWVKDEKQKLFAILCLIKALINESDRAKNHVLLPLEETPTLFPMKPEGFKKYLTIYTAKILKLLRATGYMMAGTVQNLSDIDEKVLDAFPKKFLGKVMSFSDSFALSKELKVSRDAIDLLKDVKKGRFYDLNELATQEGSANAYVMKVSTGSHCEEGMKFLTTYEKYHDKEPEKYPMQNYTDLIKQMKVLQDNEMKAVEKKAEKDFNIKQKQIEDFLNIKVEREKDKERTEQQKAELREKQEKIDLVLMKQIYDKKTTAERLNDFGKGKNLDWSKLSLEVFGKTDHKKAQRFYERYVSKYLTKDEAEQLHEELSKSPE